MVFILLVILDDNISLHILMEDINENGGFRKIIPFSRWVTVCEQLPYDKKYIIGNLAEYDLMEWWNSEQLQSWLSPPERNCFHKDIPCYNSDKDKYQECHRKYSRSLRCCNEYFGDKEMPDVNCPLADYEEFRMV